MVTDGADGRPVNRFDGKRWTTLGLSDIGGNDINAAILETQDGAIWVGGAGGNLHAYRDDGWTAYPYPGSKVIVDVKASSDYVTTESLLIQHGLAITNVEVRNQSLEDLYMKMTAEQNQ